MGCSGDAAHYARTARGAAGAGFPLAGVAPIAAPAIFAALSSALLFGRGAIVGACRLLGRGFGFAGAAVAAGAAVPFAFPFVFGAMPDVLVVGAREGRAVDGRGAVSDVGRVRVEGRDDAGCTDAADGGRARLGREDGTPLKDCRDEDREGTEAVEDPRTGATRCQRANM